MAIKVINGRTFQCEPLLATQALMLQARLFKHLGPAVNHFGAVMAGYGEDKTEQEKAASNAAALVALASVFSQARPEDVAKLVQDVIETVQIKRPSGEFEQVDLDGDFTGHQKDIIPVVLFALREQFGDFFAGMQAVGRQKAPTKA